MQIKYAWKLQIDRGGQSQRSEQVLQQIRWIECFCTWFEYCSYWDQSYEREEVSLEFMFRTSSWVLLFCGNTPYVITRQYKERIQREMSFVLRVSHEEESFMSQEILIWTTWQVDARHFPLLQPLQPRPIIPSSKNPPCLSIFLRACINIGINLLVSSPIILSTSHDPTAIKHGGLRTFSLSCRQNPLKMSLCMISLLYSSVHLF